MKGLVGVKGFFILIVLIVLFGGAIYDMTTTGVRCALGTMGHGNYTCDEFGNVAGATIVFPDRNIESGVDSIMTLRELEINDPELYASLEPLITTDEQGYRNQILIGIAGMLVIFAALIWFFIKMTPSSVIHIDSRASAVILALLVYIVAYLMFTGFIEGELQMPFTGLFKLIGNTEVMSELVDYTSALPGTLTTEDILDGETIT
jgi:hypothetical protein